MQWVGNHHNYNFFDLQRNTSHMIRLEQIRVNPQALQFANPHPKQESIWSLQYPDSFLKAPLYNYPSPELAVDAWKEDILMAHKLAHSTDMVLNDVCDNAMCDGDDDNVGGGGRICENVQCSSNFFEGEGKCIKGNDWFYHRFWYPGKQLEKSTTSDETEYHSSNGSEKDDTTNGATCLSGNNLRILLL